jgi:indole-3-glycerol phosphate synthase
MSDQKDTPTILEKIIGHKLIEVEESKKALPFSTLVERVEKTSEPLDFLKAVNPNGSLRIIAEVKHASPSKGIFREDFDPVEIARSYERGGAAALSVLTDEKFFKGSLTYLKDIRQAVDIPLLRKDFTVDPYQVFEARLYGADAILLIAAALEQHTMKELLDLAHSLGLNAIVEVHDDSELDRALDVGSRIIGINNRDLRTFEVDLTVSTRLAGRIPGDIVVVAESGIGSPEDIGKLRGGGVHVFLIGETFMRAPDPGVELQKLISSSREI